MKLIFFMGMDVFRWNVWTMSIRLRPEAANRALLKARPNVHSAKYVFYLESPSKRGRRRPKNAGFTADPSRVCIYCTNLLAIEKSK